MDVLFESLGYIGKSIHIFLTTKDLTLGAILAMLSPFFVIWAKVSREKEKKIRAAIVERRQLQIAFNVNEIMEHMGVESKWSLQEIGSTHTVQKNSNRLSAIFTKVTPVRKLQSKRRKKIMERLKSRKLWISVVAAILLVLKEGLDIQVDSEVVLGFAGIVISAILGFAHVDAKKELKNNEPTPTISTSEFEG